MVIDLPKLSRTLIAEGQKDLVATCSRWDRQGRWLVLLAEAALTTFTPESEAARMATAVLSGRLDSDYIHLRKALDFINDSIDSERQRATSVINQAVAQQRQAVQHLKDALTKEQEEKENELLAVEVGLEDALDRAAQWKAQKSTWWPKDEAAFFTQLSVVIRVGSLVIFLCCLWHESLYGPRLGNELMTWFFGGLAGLGWFFARPLIVGGFRMAAVAQSSRYLAESRYMESVARSQAADRERQARSSFDQRLAAIQADLSNARTRLEQSVHCLEEVKNEIA